MMDIRNDMTGVRGQIKEEERVGQPDGRKEGIGSGSRRGRVSLSSVPIR